MTPIWNEIDAEKAEYEAALVRAFRIVKIGRRLRKRCNEACGELQKNMQRAQALLHVERPA